MVTAKRRAQNRLNKQYQRLNEKINAETDETVRSALEQTRKNLDALRDELRQVDKNDVEKITEILLDYQENAAYTSDKKKAVEYVTNTMAFQEVEIETDDGEILYEPAWKVSKIFAEWEEIKGEYIGPSGNLEARAKAMIILEQIKDLLSTDNQNLTQYDIDRLSQLQQEIEERLEQRGRKKGTRNRYKAHRRTKAEMAAERNKK